MGWAAALSLLVATPLPAQQENPLDAEPTRDEPFPQLEGARRLGPVRVIPGLTIRNLGYDDNIFSSKENKTSDFTGEVIPSLTAQILLGHRGALTVREAPGVEFFVRNTDETNINNLTEARGDLLLGALLLTGRGDLEKRNLTPGSEIDERPERRRRSAGLELRWFQSSRTDLLMAGERVRFRYQDDDFFTDVEPLDPDLFEDDPDCRDVNVGGEDRFRCRLDLGELLDREETGLRLRLRWKGLPRTRLFVQAERREYRFDDPRLSRDSDDSRWALGAQTNSAGRVSGRFLLGAVDFRPDDPRNANFRGLYGEGRLALRFLSRLETIVGYERDIEFSSFDNILFYRRHRWQLEQRIALWRTLRLQVGFDQTQTRYPTEGQVLFPDEVRRDRIRTLFAGFRVRLLEDWLLDLRLGVRDQQSNYPPADDDQQFFIRNGVRFRF